MSAVLFVFFFTLVIKLPFPLLTYIFVFYLYSLSSPSPVVCYSLAARRTYILSSPPLPFFSRLTFSLPSSCGWLFPPHACTPPPQALTRFSPSFSPFCPPTVATTCVKGSGKGPWKHKHYGEQFHGRKKSAAFFFFYLLSANSYKFRDICGSLVTIIYCHMNSIACVLVVLK